MKDDYFLSKFYTFMRNTRHYRMEHFTVLFFILVFAMVAVSSVCFMRDLAAKRVTLSTKSKYTTTFTTSKTKIQGTVEGIYASEDHKKAFALVYFNDNRIISTDAKQYRAFLTGANLKGNSQNITGSPSGSIYVFGRTGYVGIYLVNQEGFPSQILDLTVRFLRELKLQEGAINSNTTNEDASFDKYDQFKIYFNPGAKGVDVIDCLNSKQAPSAKALFDQTVGAKEFQKTQETLRRDLDRMATLLVQIEEYTHRLDKQSGLQVPQPPAFIAGDHIVRDDKGTPNDSSDDTYDISFNAVAEGGFDVDWQGKTLEDDLLLKAMTSEDALDLEPERYLIQKDEMRRTSVSNTLGSLQNIVWIMKDGSLLESLNTGSQVGRYADINKDVQLLLSAWRNYGDIKLQYQTTNLGKLLSLNLASTIVADGTDINAGDDVLRIY